MFTCVSVWFNSLLILGGNGFRLLPNGDDRKNGNGIAVKFFYVFLKRIAKVIETVYICGESKQLIMELGEEEEFLNGEPSAFASMISTEDFGIIIQKGLTKREYFAAAALSGLLASPHTNLWVNAPENAVRIADMLIKELGKEE